MFHYDFMQHAFVAGTIVAIMCGVIGVFVIARNLSFIAHTFSHIGFSGASFAVYMGWHPLSGLLLFTVGSALAVGQLGVKVFRRDVSISVVLSIFLGLGILFLSLSTKQASTMFSLLFGSVVGISYQDVWELAALAVIVLLILCIGYRMLKFDSFDPLGAQAAGLPIRLISIGFLLLLSVAVAEAVQIVGALLVFTLMTTPAAAARYLTHSVPKMIICSSVIAVLGVWAGIILGYYSNAPVSFYITAVEGILYFAALGWHNLREKVQVKEAAPSPQPETAK
ncbi:zinc/manganese transport system permease protein [Paenibacillus sp. yr247]|uniref:metal ABC transporter permease n=1 Tax=Paenibacillus sp. yr247 TaxID=1761880 RepID=UPI0008832F58|nr:metal ABC transporter permease [Paenibacillus sp. yr247]SDP09890.1 zinc/manganese transport system permease protein [Paenibacillus sp. yr247]